MLDNINKWADADPKKSAIIYHDIPVSYAEFRGLIFGAVHKFRGSGFRAGSVVAISIQNILAGWIAVLALRSLGFDTVVVPSADAIDGLNARKLAGIVILQSETDPAGLSNLKRFGAPIVPINDGLQGSDVAPRIDRPAGGHILFTSGTTGVYKKLFFDAEKIDRVAQKRLAENQFSPDSVVHNLNFPLWTGAGFKTPLAAWTAGACIILDQRPNCLLNLFQHPITDATLIPAMAKTLLKLLDGRPPSPGSFALYTSAGAFSLDLAESVRTHITPNINLTYSATECGNMFLTPYTCTEDLIWQIPVDTRHIRIVSEDEGRDCAVGEEGQFAIELTDRDCIEYLDDPAATLKSFRDGYFYPGDRAVRREDGRIRVLGRTEDVINLRGYKIAASPLELQIQRALKVGTVCLFTGLSAETRDQLVVVIEAANQPSAADEALIRKIVDWQDDLRVIVLPEFPRTATAMQKLDRITLRKIAFAPA